MQETGARSTGSRIGLKFIIKKIKTTADRQRENPSEPYRVKLLKETTSVIGEIS